MYSQLFVFMFCYIEFLLHKNSKSSSFVDYFNEYTNLYLKYMIKLNYIIFINFKY